MAEEYRVSFRDKDMCGRQFGTFRFDRPQGYDFVAGRWMNVALDTAAGRLTHQFSIASAPHDDHLEISTRMTGSPFKSALEALRPGDEVTISGPRGRLGVEDDGPPVVFLTGGVGITPVRSIVSDQMHRRTGLPMTLFFGNNEMECVPYHDELVGYDQAGDAFTLILVIVSPPEGWEGEHGFITAPMVRNHIDPAEEAHWIVVGPPAMNDAMKRVLAELEVPDERVSFELFAGYK